MERFCDIEISNKRLTHIHGYQSKNLVSIEEALKPIVTQIDELPKYIKMAKKYCHYPSEHDLSKDESASVYIYTMDWGDTSLYRVLNKALRSENRQDIQVWFSYLKLFDTALQKLPTIKGPVWRGINFDVEKKFIRDQILTWWGISSCSLSPHVIETFLRNGQNGTLFLIEAITGKKVSGYTEFENEEEVILKMGTQLRVKGVPLQHKNGLYIVHLIEINDDNNSDSSSVSKTNDFFLPIRNEYLRNSRIQRMMNEAKTFPIEQSYVNLAVVETKEQQEQEKKLRQSEYKDAIITSFEDIYGSKTSVNVKHIFEKCKDQIKKVLVLGRAGIGKSTFCRYISYQWAKNELYTQYQLVVLIRLRLLTSDRYPPGTEYSPVDIVKKEYFPYDIIPDKDKQYFKELCDKGQVLWLLDGYDEFVQNTPKHLKDLLDYILNTQHHILTSRPYSITLSYDVKMEITGFIDDNISKYVEQFFDQIKDQLPDALSEAQKLQRFLKTNPGIWGVAHIPVNLEMICSLWVDIDRSAASMYTVTRLYESMTEWLCRRYLTKQNIDNTNMKKETIYGRCQKELAFLESLAFHGMEDNCIILRPNLLERAEKEADCNLDDHPELLKTGVLHSLNDKPIGSQIQSQIDYYFVHLSFQEHFAARYLVNALSSSAPHEATEFIKNNKYNQRFALVFAFASGLLSDRNADQSLYKFWGALSQDPLDLVGFRHIQLVISCLGEISDELKIRHTIELVDSIRKWTKYVLSTKSGTLYTQFSNSLQRSSSLVREPAITNQFIELINSSDSHVRLNTCTLISELSIYNPRQEFIPLLTNALEDEYNIVRSFACDALGAMGEKGATIEVISKLVSSALGDEDLYVSSRACDALGRMREKAATSELINKLVNTLRDKDSDIRSRACNALGAMGERAATSEVISKLVMTLGDEDSNLRYAACDALGAMGEKAATSEVISKLVSTLADEDSMVKRAARAALTVMGETTATSKVISELISALGDDNSSLRNDACDAFRAMGETAATHEVISKLVSSALGDEDENVRNGARFALGAMTEKVATNELINKLVSSALADEDSNIRSAACNALGAMGQNAATSEVISKLVIALIDEDENVRCAACDALGAMGDKAATSEVISKLVMTLGDEDSNLRYAACDALGAMGEKAATSEVISKLVSTLADEDSMVKRAARAALTAMGETTATSKVINELVSALRDDNSSLRYDACDALGAMGEKAGTSEVISKLVSRALADEDLNVRWKACYALTAMGEKAATSEVINKLVSALGDKSSNVRHVACYAVGIIGEKAATSEVISKLVSVLEDEDSDVRSCACSALGAMGDKAAISEVISKLVSALEDEDENVRYGACDALGAIGEKAAISEVISKLVMALGDENKNVRSCVCSALGAMGGKAATSEVISELISALGDEDSNVRSCACDALRAMGEKAATNEVISKLVGSALGDEDPDVRNRACFAVGVMGEKAATSEVISELISALGDEDTNVRSCACDALRAMGEKAATSEVINKLVSSAFRDEAPDVRSRARYALGAMGEKAATSEVISKLVSALRDEDTDVRYWAYFALGKMDEKRTTSVLISKLVNALEDDDANVRRMACNLLSKMGEKVATSEVINKMLELLENGNRVDDDLAKILQKLFTSFTMMTALDSDTVRKLLTCLDRNSLRDLTVVAPEILIKSFLHTKNSLWLSMASRIALLQGVGITVVEKTIVVYYSKEPVMLECNDSELVDQLIDIFAEQAVRFDLPCMCPRKASVSVILKEKFLLSCDTLPNTSVRREKHWCSCIVL